MAGSSAVSDSWIAYASASAIRPIATCAGSDACIAGWVSARVIEAVCSRYGVDGGRLATCGSRSPARAALAYLAKHHNESTRAELVPILGLSRPESVPNLSARFAALLQTQSNARRYLMALELALGLSGKILNRSEPKDGSGLSPTMVKSWLTMSGLAATGIRKLREVEYRTGEACSTHRRSCGIGGLSIVGYRAGQ